MRRPAKAALAISLATVAALALQAGAATAASGSDPVFTFTRATAPPAYASTRVWSVFRGTLGDTGDGSSTDDPQMPVLPSSLPRDTLGQLNLLHAAGLATDADTLEAAVKELELPFMFAGRQQWVMNLTSADGAASDPRLWDVSMESPVTDPAAMHLLLGRAAWAVESRHPMSDDVTYWESLVPKWAPDVRDELAAQGIPFSVELLASPEIDLYDATKPLFPMDAAPVSLFQLSDYQGGENAFLRSLSAEELMTTVYPMYYRTHHRAAGAPVPADLLPGLGFGQVTRVACSDNTANGCIDGVRYQNSPIMDTDAYQRWALYGTPGLDTNGYILDAGTGWGYNPLTGDFKQLATPTNPHFSSMLGQLQSGAIQSGYITNDWDGFVLDATGSPISAAGFLGDPSVFFQGPNEKFAPDKLDSDTVARYLAIESETAAATPPSS